MVGGGGGVVLRINVGGGLGELVSYETCIIISCVSMVINIGPCSRKEVYSGHPPSAYGGRPHGLGGLEGGAYHRGG